MVWQAWLTAGIVLVMLGAMATDRAKPETAIGAALAALILLGLVTPARAVAGFANEGVLTIALLYVVAAAVRRSGALGPIVGLVLGRAGRPGMVLLRLMAPVALASGVLNNTPLVAMLLPEVRAWARRHNVAPSRLLLPLSYAAIVGGLLTVMGTSTNLVVNGLLVEAGLAPIGFADIGRIGLPIAVGGIALLALFHRWLLPDRPESDAIFADPRAFTTELMVEKGGPFDGRALIGAKLADGSPLLPVEIARDGHVLGAPRLDEILVAGDRLIIAGDATTVVAASATVGLGKAVTSAFDVHALGAERQLVEVVVSDQCPLVGGRVGEGSFRANYGAAIIAIARHGERVQRARAGGWNLLAGDTLLVEAGSEFVATYRFHPHFHVVLGAAVQAPAPGSHAVIALATLGAMVSLASTGVLSVLEAAIAACVVLFFTRVVDQRVLRESVDLRVLFAIAAALGVGAAIDQSGLAALAADGVVGLAGDSPRLALAAVLVASVAATEVLTNNAAAVLMLPLALATAHDLGCSTTPFAVAVMVGASASFVTPTGYQTNLMVFGPGGYRFVDFVRAGLPMSLLVVALSIWLLPLLWPLAP